MVVPDWVMEGQGLVPLAPGVPGSGIAINNDRRHAELAQPRAEGDPSLPAANDDHIRLGCMTELLRFASALLEPGPPIRDSAVLYSLGSPVTLRLLMTLELVQRCQQCPGLAVSESD